MKKKKKKEKKKNKQQKNPDIHMSTSEELKPFI